MTQMLAQADEPLICLVMRNGDLSAHRDCAARVLCFLWSYCNQTALAFYREDKHESQL